MIRHDLEEFLARSTDRTLADTDIAFPLQYLKLGAEGPWLGGGALRRTLLGEAVDSDFDFFFRDEDQLLAFAGRLTGLGFEKVRETQHHVQFRGCIPGDKVRDIQCIRFSYYPSAEAVIDSFDFTVCQFVFDGRTLTCGDHALWDLGRKRLAVHKVTYPVATMRRLLKYTQQGFYACAGCLSTILTATAGDPALLQALDIQYVD